TPPRHRQDRHPDPAPAETGTAHQKRVRNRETPHHTRRPDPLQNRLNNPATRQRDRTHPSRTLGRDRLPTPAQRSTNPPQRTHRRPRRRLRRAHTPTTLQTSLATPPRLPTDRDARPQPTRPTPRRTIR